MPHRIVSYPQKEGETSLNPAPAAPEAPEADPAMIHMARHSAKHFTMLCFPRVPRISLPFIRHPSCSRAAVSLYCSFYKKHAIKVAANPFQILSGTWNGP
jgi:hypothetical protein